MVDLIARTQLSSYDEDAKGSVAVLNVHTVGKCFACTVLIIERLVAVTIFPLALVIVSCTDTVWLNC